MDYFKKEIKMYYERRTIPKFTRAVTKREHDCGIKSKWSRLRALALLKRMFKRKKPIEHS